MNFDRSVCGDRGLVCTALKAVATFGCSTFFGTALYVNVVETEARASVKSGDFQVDHFQATFPRAKAFQGSLGVLAFVAGGLTLLLEPRRLASKIFFAGGTAMILLWPYTLVVIMPINRKLMNGNEPKEKGEAYTRNLLRTWNQLHAVRTAVSGIVLGAFLYGWTRK